MNPALNPEAILDFLQQNPDFLLQHPEILPQQQGNVVSFQNVMVQKLRQDKQRVEDKQRLLVENARNNMTVLARVHAAAVRLLEARNFEEMIEIIGNELTLMLEVDVISVLIETPIDPNMELPQNIRLLEIGLIDRLLGNQDNILQANIAGDPLLYGSAARLVKSQVLMRLNIAENIPDGLLAFGSRDPLLFNDGQGTELIGFLGDIIERLVRRFLVY